MLAMSQMPQLMSQGRAIFPGAVDAIIRAACSFEALEIGLHHLDQALVVPLQDVGRLLAHVT